MGATASLTGTTEEETHVIHNIKSVLETIAKNDAQSVDNSCVGFGTNDKDLVELLTSRTKLQLEALDKEYRKSHEGRKLEDVIDSETSGDYRKFLKLMIQPRGLFLCQQLKKAMDGMGTDEKRMNEIFCVISTEDMKAMKDTYEGLTGNRLLDTVRSELSGEHKELVAHLLTEGRDHSTVINQELAKEQAEKLIEIIENGKGFFGGLKEEAKVKFSRKIAKISPYQLYAVQDEWDRAGQEMSLQATIKKLLGGDLEEATLYLLKRPEDFYAEKIKQACDGLGTDEDFLSYIVGGVDKHTALKVADRFYQKFNQDVIARMHDEVSGDYKMALIGWLKNEDPSKGMENELWQCAPGSIRFCKVAMEIFANLIASPSAQGHILSRKERPAAPLAEERQAQQQPQHPQQPHVNSNYRRRDDTSDSETDSSHGSATGKLERRRQRKAERRERHGGPRKKIMAAVKNFRDGSDSETDSSHGSATGKLERRRQRKAERRERHGGPRMKIMAAVKNFRDGSDSETDSSHGSATGKLERRRQRKAERRERHGGQRKRNGARAEKSESGSGSDSDSSGSNRSENGRAEKRENRRERRRKNGGRGGKKSEKRRPNKA